jgi:hypothetical protein
VVSSPIASTNVTATLATQDYMIARDACSSASVTAPTSPLREITVLSSITLTSYLCFGSKNKLLSSYYICINTDKKIRNSFMDLALVLNLSYNLKFNQGLI